MPTLATDLVRPFALGLILSLSPVWALAQSSPPSCDLGDYDPSQSPDPAGTPTEVGVGIYVVHLDRVDNLDQSFRLDFFLRLSWQDPRLAAVVGATGGRGCRFPLADVWEPRVLAFNRQDASLLLPRVVNVDAEGRVLHLQRVQTTLRAPMDLRDFPIDHQVLPLTLISIEYGPESVSLVTDETAATREHDVTIPGWEIHELVRRGGVLEAEVADEATQNRRFSRYDYEFHVSRELAFYVWRVIGPLTFIVLMSWAVFWIDPSNFGVQIGLASTSILTLVAFLFSLNNILPPLSYLTRMDFFLFVSLALALLAFAEAVTTAVLKAQDRETLALRMDRWARWLFPIAFGALHVVMWTL
jgi:hypothetical protein